MHDGQQKPNPVHLYLLVITCREYSWAHYEYSWGHHEVNQIMHEETTKASDVIDNRLSD